MYFEFCIRDVIVISLPCSYIYLYFTLKFKEVTDADTDMPGFQGS